jgi:peptide/nickel transport system permease protein
MSALAATDVVEPSGGDGAVRQLWMRLREDKLAATGAILLLILVLATTLGAWLAAQLLGHGPDHLFYDGVREDGFTPVGIWSHVTDPVSGERTLLVLGASDELGRDQFLRVLYGGRASLEVAFGATLLGLAVGVVLGALAGYFGGIIDAIVSRLTEATMILPQLFIIVALSSTAGPRLDHITLGVFPQGVVKLVLLLAFFSWFYPARIARAQMLSLRGREFVEAARMVGASELRILRVHLLPYLLGPLTAYGSVLMAQNVLAETGLSFLGYGISLPTASWGSLLAGVPQLAAPDSGGLAHFFHTTPQILIIPSVAVLSAALAFSLLADWLRGASDPHAGRPARRP